VTSEQPTPSPKPHRKPHSHTVTDGVERAASRGMLRAVGMGDDDWRKPQIAVASSWNEITPCNLSLDRLAKQAKVGVRQADAFPLEFGTISVSDGISMGHTGMHYSLVSREIIADSVETVIRAEQLDGAVLLAGCDKSLPGMLMAAARLDIAAVFLYAGSTLPGKLHGNDVTIIDAFEGVGACLAGKITRDELDDIERAICPGEGACGGMYTANTMASAAEALGMSLTGSAAPPAPDARRDAFAIASGEAVVALVDSGVTARQILTIEAFENAITLVMALGGSTNAVLHLLAIAREGGVPLTLDDFNRIGDKVPHLADMKPFGRFVMTDIDRIGGIPVVMRALLDAGLMHGDALTVTGRTLAENLADIAPPLPDGEVIRPLDRPIHRTGGLTILHGSLAPEGAVVKTAGFDAEVFAGTARVFDREQEAMEAVAAGTLKAGDIVVIRWEGPRAAPACARCSRSPERSRGPALARMSCSSPTVASPAGRRGSASATWRQRPRSADPSPWWLTVTGSSSTSSTAESTSRWTRPSWLAAVLPGCRTSRLSTTASWASTRSSSALPRTAPSAADPHQLPGSRAVREPAWSSARTG
jgi:dihydroxy-acid dehydratase